jgi:hypothetical protein
VTVPGVEQSAAHFLAIADIFEHILLAGFEQAVKAVRCNTVIHEVLLSMNKTVLMNENPSLTPNSNEHFLCRR